MDVGLGRPTKFPWKEIEQDAVHNGLNYKELEIKYNISRDTVRRYADRHQWPMAYRLIPKLKKKVLELATEKAVERAADEWINKGDDHRKMVFKLANESLAKMPIRAPKNFREAEAADKMARRAAGLDVTDINQQTLININESIDSFDEPAPIEAVVIQDVRELNPPSSEMESEPPPTGPS